VIRCTLAMVIVCRTRLPRITPAKAAHAPTSPLRTRDAVGIVTPGSAPTGTDVSLDGHRPGAAIDRFWHLSADESGGTLVESLNGGGVHR
jgi:hypothetical protein